LSALAHEGLGNREQAMRDLEEILREDRNYLFASEMLSWIDNERRPPLKRIGEQVQS